MRPGSILEGMSRIIYPTQSIQPDLQQIRRHPKRVS